MPARLEDGSRAVLKVCFPHDESEHEAEALQHWDGNGSVRLLAHDRERWALLIEECCPGRHLSEVGQETALDVFIELLPRLWVPAAVPFRALRDETERWKRSMPLEWERKGRPFERKLVDAAIEACSWLVDAQAAQVLVNQDLHGENVLSAEREPWLVIDPKPLVGEREFGVASIVRALEFGHSAEDVGRRLDRLCEELELDRERSRMWTIVHTLAWCFDSEYRDQQVEVVRWLLA